MLGSSRLGLCSSSSRASRAAPKPQHTRLRSLAPPATPASKSRSLRSLCRRLPSTAPKDSNGTTVQTTATSNRDSTAGRPNGTRSMLSEPPLSAPAASQVQPQQEGQQQQQEPSSSVSTHPAAAATPQSQPPAKQSQQQQQETQGELVSVQQLTSNVQVLLSTVQAQQEMLQQQQAEIQSLRQTVASLQQLQPQPQQQRPSNEDHHHQQRQQQQQEAAAAAAAGGGGAGLLSSSSASVSVSGNVVASMRPFDAQRLLLDRRYQGLFDARYHSTSMGAVPRDTRVLPHRIILVRHAQSEGNVNQATYTYLPDPQVPLTALGREQAHEAGEAIRAHMQALHGGSDYNLYFYTSPYKRGVQTYEGIRAAFASSQVLGVQEEVQLREQDFGNFQRVEDKQREKEERLRFGRFFYRFPNGESGADVYDRMTVFMDHLVRDINAGRFPPKTSLVLVTHGLALRIWLMRWFHWKVDELLDVYNPPNAVPLFLERIDGPSGSSDVNWVHTKAMYRFSPDSMKVLRGVTPDMCATSPLPPGSTWNEGGVSGSSPAGGIGGVGGFAGSSNGGGGGGSDGGGESGAGVDGSRGESGAGVDGSRGESAAEQWADLGGGW